MSFPVSAFQIRAVPSEPAVTTRRPPGPNSESRTFDFGLCRSTTINAPVAAFHRRAELSGPAVTTRFPSGLKGGLQLPAARSQDRFGLASARVPHARRPVPPGRYDALAGRVEMR